MNYKTLHCRILMVLGVLFSLSACSRLNVSNFAQYQTSFSGITSVSDVGCHTGTLRWTAASGAVRYDIYNTSSGQPVFLSSVNPPTTQYSVSGLMPGTTYLFQVHALNNLNRLDTNVNSQAVTTQGTNCYSTTILTDRPLGFWRLDEDTGATVAADSSGNGYHGTYNPGVTRGVSGPLLVDPATTSAFFDGVSGTVTLPNSLVIPVNSPITVEFWTYVTTADAAGTHTSFTLGNLNSPSRCQAHLPYDPIGYYWDYGNIGGAGRISGAYPASGLDRWAHAVVVSAGALGSFKAVYLNGALLSSAGSSGGPTVPLVGGYIGGELTGGTYLKGKISQFAVYNYVLSATQIAAHYRAAGY